MAFVAYNVVSKFKKGLYPLFLIFQQMVQWSWLLEVTIDDNQTDVHEVAIRNLKLGSKSRVFQIA